METAGKYFDILDTATPMVEVPAGLSTLSGSIRDSL
jgi:hypothetical protein